VQLRFTLLLWWSLILLLFFPFFLCICLSIRDRA
jgi:hypothetical protein